MKLAAVPLGLAVCLLARPAAAAQADFQHACERLVGDRAIAIVAVEPGSGRLKALVHPGLAREPHPPGSVFKLVTALAAIEAGVAPPGALFRCSGAYRVPGSRGKPLPCWKPGGHGTLALEEAIAQSCNVSFYQIGARVGPQLLLQTATRCGLGAAPGWLRPPQGPLDTAGLAIGEGAGLGLTAEQLTGFVAAIATGGALLTPGWTVGDRSGRALAVGTTLARLRAGMRAAVVHGNARAAAVPGLAIAGKTGTATFTDGSHRTSGWFLGYAPAEHPRLAIVVFQRLGTGFGDAAPLARKVFLAWQAAGAP